MMFYEKSQLSKQFVSKSYYLIELNFSNYYLSQFPSVMFACFSVVSEL